MAFIFSKSTPLTGAEAIFNLKQLLKTAGWTVQSSSDGTTYNASDDQITVSGSGAGGMANNNAWFRIRSPDGVGSQEFIFQRGTGNQSWRIKRSRTAGFTGGSPGATQTPSATDQTILLGSGTDASPVFIHFFTPDGGSYRWNVCADNAAPFGFWAGSFANGVATTQAALVLDPLAFTQPTDADQYAIYVGSNASSFFYSTLGATTGTTANRMTSQIISTSPGSSYAEYAAFRALDSTNLVLPAALVTNPITTQDTSFPIFLARHNTLPNPGFKGMTTIMRYNGTPRTTGTTASLAVPRDRIIYGVVNLPWDGTVPTV